LAYAIGYDIEDDQDIFCLKLCTASHAPGEGFHLALSAASRIAVDNFYRQALQTGGLDNGCAGLRLDYGDHYYAAFVVDPDGYRIEAVCKVALA
jgi:predicted lactoylglutathione lyase